MLYGVIKSFLTEVPFRVNVSLWLHIFNALTCTIAGINLHEKKDVLVILTVILAFTGIIWFFIEAIII